jgi:hypothetical protein
MGCSSVADGVRGRARLGARRLGVDGGGLDFIIVLPIRERSTDSDAPQLATRCPVPIDVGQFGNISISQQARMTKISGRQGFRGLPAGVPCAFEHAGQRAGELSSIDHRRWYHAVAIPPPDTGGAATRTLRQHKAAASLNYV